MLKYKKQDGFTNTSKMKHLQEIENENNINTTEKI
jgi:hypothetical protein